MATNDISRAADWHNVMMEIGKGDLQMNTLYIESCIERLKFEASQSDLRLIALAEKELAVIKEAAQQSKQAYEPCADCRLQYTSSCPSLLGVRCSYFQPRY